MATTPSLKPARRSTTGEGHVRRVGYELEFAGIQLEEAATLTQQAVGGELERINSFAFRITGAPSGDYAVELDASLLKNKRYETFLENIGVRLKSEDKSSVEEMLRRISQAVVPTEVVCPPVPMDAMEPVEEIRRTLHEHHALGSGASPLYAFGLQINVEPPDLSVQTILAYLRSFLLLYPWLDKEIGIDLSRRVSPFIDPFDADFVEAFLSEDAEFPSMRDLMETYLNLSPTRNRPLDLLPLFSHLDADYLENYPVEHHLIKSRPALHYRLPNCRIDDPEWTIAHEWGRWLQVERLAEDPEAIRRLSRQYLNAPSFPLNIFEPSWAKTMDAWLAGDR